MTPKPDRGRRDATPRASALQLAVAALGAVGSLLLLGLPSPAAAADPAPVSFYKDVAPVLRRSCHGCHNPEKADGKLDMTTRAGMLKGGKTDPLFVPGKPGDSIIMDMIAGDEPAMPKKGVKLTAEEVALVERWIREGAVEDAAPAAAPDIPAVPPVYVAPPVIADLKYSPDGKLLAMTGYHEVIVYKADGSERVARLLGASPQIKSLAFSPDGALLAVGGGSPYEFGEIQIWDVATSKLVSTTRIGKDTVFGLSFSPDGKRVAFGMTDNSARMIEAATGKEVFKFEAHSDWTLTTAFTMDGARLLCGSRDMAMKLVRVDNAQFIDDINNPLDQILTMARDPKRDVVAYGGAQGIARIYKMSDNQGRTAARLDNNLMKSFERLPGAIHAVAWSPDGATLAVGGAFPEVALFDAKKAARTGTLKGPTGAVFALDFAPDGKRVAAGGFDGLVRIYDVGSEKPALEFAPVPLLTEKVFREAVGLDAPAKTPVVKPAEKGGRGGSDGRGGGTRGRRPSRAGARAAASAVRAGTSAVGE